MQVSDKIRIEQVIDNLEVMAHEKLLLRWVDSTLQIINRTCGLLVRQRRSPDE